VNYTYPYSEQDLASICTQMPSMPQCTIKRICWDNGIQSKYCDSFSLLKSACLQMDSVECSNIYSMCNYFETAIIQQCNTTYLKLPSVNALRQNINSICSLMPMDGCYDCSANCDLLSVYSVELCMQMPKMMQCNEWVRLCEVVPDWPLCQSSQSNYIPGQTMPHMASYFHLGYSEYIYFQSWVPQNEVEFIGACFFLFVLCILHKAMRQVQLQTMIWQKSPQISEEHRVRKIFNKFSLYVGPLRWTDLVQSLLTFFESMLGFIIMLLVMTFNFWFLLSVGIGYAFGGFLFARISLLNSESEKVKPQRELLQTENEHHFGEKDISLSTDAC